MSCDDNRCHSFAEGFGECLVMVFEKLCVVVRRDDRTQVSIYAGTNQMLNGLLREFYVSLSDLEFIDDEERHSFRAILDRILLVESVLLDDLLGVSSGSDPVSNDAPLACRFKAYRSKTCLSHGVISHEEQSLTVFDSMLDMFYPI